ncbi:MAG TPA: CDP-alcohol phosphatidyltransferase family protein [Candidatus Eisenbacteria bacterium]
MFIEDYLKDLRRDRFSLPAMVTYARRAAGRTRECLVANPGAVRSLWSVALLFFAAAFIAAATLALRLDRGLAHDFFYWTAFAILPVFTLVTLHLDLLRDRQGYRLSAINLPIALTLLRATLVPAILLFLLRRHDALALAAFLIATISDVLDGWLARRWSQVTHLGVVLDPIVDIAFNLSIFLGLARVGLIPTWVCVAAVLRYAILLIGGIGLHLFVGPVRIHPTFFGRLTGVVMAALMALLVLLRVLQGRVADRLIPLTQVALGVLVCATVVQVVALGWYNLRVMSGTAAPGQVVGDVRWGAR